MPFQRRSGWCGPGFGQELFELRQIPVVVELRGVEPCPGRPRHGDAIDEELIPGPLAADPVPGVDAAEFGSEVALDLIPVVLNQVEDDGAFPAASSSVTCPQVRQVPSGGGLAPRPKWVLRSLRNSSHRSGAQSADIAMMSS